MKVRINKLTEKEIIHTLDNLYTAASSLKGRNAVKLFLKDLLTPSERIMLGRRILIARKILKGETHEEIVKNLGVGFDTIARVQKWLSDQMPGYEQAITGLENEFKKRKAGKLYRNNLIYKLKKKYPLHFLLIPMPKVKDDNI